jgi:hypothetical protein
MLGVRILDFMRFHFKSSPAALLFGTVGLFLITPGTFPVAFGADQNGGTNAGTSPKRAYSVTGRASYDNFGDYRLSYDFCLTVSNDWWGMEFVPIPSDGERALQICVGSNLVAMTYFPIRARSRSREGVVEVESQKTPLMGPVVAHVVFVGFAGQFYLPPGTNGLLSPLWHPERELNRVAFVKSEWHLLAPGRPDFVQCLYEPLEWNERLGQKPKAYIRAKNYWTPPVALYRSVNTTNLGGEIFPADYAFTAFSPGRTDVENIFTPLYTVQVTNVVLRAKIEAPLLERSFKGIAVVVDRRDGRELEYNITNAAPPGLR